MDVTGGLSMSVRRRPWFAALLSFVVPGTGQLYGGRLKRGLLLFGLHALAVAAFCLVAWVPRGATGFALLSVAAIATPLVLVLAVVDAFLIARRSLPGGAR